MWPQPRQMKSRLLKTKGDAYRSGERYQEKLLQSSIPSNHGLMTLVFRLIESKSVTSASSLYLDPELSKMYDTFQDSVRLYPLTNRKIPDDRDTDVKPALNDLATCGFHGDCAGMPERIPVRNMTCLANSCVVPVGGNSAWRRGGMGFKR